MSCDFANRFQMMHFIACVSVSASSMVSCSMSGRRGRIAEVRITGFKSVSKRLAFKVPAGPLIAVIGKNGAGKSNILDALLFAAACPTKMLGVRSLTDLRCTDVKEVRLLLCRLLLGLRTV